MVPSEVRGKTLEALFALLNRYADFRILYATSNYPGRPRGAVWSVVLQNSAPSNSTMRPHEVRVCVDTATGKTWTDIGRIPQKSETPTQKSEGSK